MERDEGLTFVMYSFLRASVKDLKRETAGFMA